MSLTISATEVARFGSRRLCLRCAWVRLRVKSLPYQSFPGIFSSIDSYNKGIVRSYFHRESSLPSWLQELGKVEELIKPPHWSRFKVSDEGTGVTLRGEPDAVFRMEGGSYAILDYKTSRYNTPGQQAQKQVYEAQLNAYAYIGEHMPESPYKVSPVGQLALVYMEPVTDEETVESPHLIDGQGFSMGFRARVVPVSVKPDRVVPPLLRKARQISEMDSPPAGLEDCRDCQAVSMLISELG